MKSGILSVTLVLLFASSSGSFAQAPTAVDINALKTQIDALKADYEKRIQALETQLQEIQALMLQIAPQAAETAAPPPATVPTTAGALNPAISVISNSVGRIDNRQVFSEDGERIDNITVQPLVLTSAAIPAREQQPAQEHQ